MLKISISLLVSLTLTATVSAVTIAYDGFEAYAANVNLNGGSSGMGWTGDWVTEGDHTTVQNSLPSDPNGNVSAGSRSARLQATEDLGNQNSFIQRAFSSTTSSIYVSFLIRNVSGVGSDDFYNFQVSNGATGNSSNALGVGIRNNPDSPFFARVGSSGNATTNATINATEGDDFLIVAKFSKDGSLNYNRTDLYINPVSSTEPGTADATAIFAGTGISELTLFSVRNFSPEDGDTVFIDELRIATTFADIIPEPSSSLLLLVGSLGLALSRRR